MANPHQQYPYNPRPPSGGYPNPGGMMNMNPAAMNLSMGGGAPGMNMGGMHNMAGMQAQQMGGIPQPSNPMQNQLLNQYQMQMRTHAGNAQQQHLQSQQMHPSHPSYGAPGGGGAPGMGMPGPQQMQQPGMIPQQPNAYGMGGGMNPSMGMKQPSGMPLSYPPAHQSPYQQPGQQPQYPQQSQPYGGAPGMQMGYPQRPPTAQGNHAGPNPGMPQQPQMYSQPGMGMGGMQGMNSMGYQQNGMPGRPPSAMSGQQPPMGGMPSPSKTPQQLTGHMNPPPPPQNPMMPGHQMSNPGMMGMPNSMMGNMSQPLNPMQTQNMTPQQMIQLQQMQQQQQQHRQQQPPQGHPSTPHQQSHHPPGSQPGTMNYDGSHQQGPPAGPTSIQIPASPASAGAMGQQPQSAPGRSPTPTQTPQSAGGIRAATPTSAPPMHAPSPIYNVGMPGGGAPASAGTPMSARPPSAAGSASGGGMMPPPNQPGVPGKLGFPLNTAQMDPSVLSQLQMLGQHAGMGGVSGLGPGMFNNSISPSGGPGQPPGMHPGQPMTNGAPVHGAYNPGAGNIAQNSLRQVGPTPIPSLQQNPRLPLSVGGLSMNVPPGMGGSSLAGQMPLTAPPLPSGGMMTRPNRAPSAPQPSANPAERTMSPHQRAAVIPTITRITAVPADDKDHPLSELLPPLNAEEIDNVHQWIEKDRKYESEYRKMKDAMAKELAEAFAPVPIPRETGGPSLPVPKPLRWFEKDWRDSKHDARAAGRLMWPSQKRAEKEKKFRLLGRKPVILQKPAKPEDILQPELLVPIRLDVDIGDGYNRLRDTFVWNANDPHVTLAIFAQSLCDDFSIGFGLGSGSESARVKFIQQVLSSMQEQITDFKNHRVEIDSSVPQKLPPVNKPVSTLGGLKVNLRDQSRSRSATPLPGDPEKSDKPQPINTLIKRTSSHALASESGVGRKRPRPVVEGRPGAGKLEDEDEEWWERWRKRMRVIDGSSARPARATKSSKKALPNNTVPNGTGIKLEISDVDLKRPLAKQEETDEYKRDLIFVEEEEPESAGGLNEDLRIVIKLDIAFGIRRLEDNFEWDISDKRNSPEQFAERYCIELGLSGEFKTAIAHSIREQVQVHEKSLFLVGHPMDGSTILDEDLRLVFLPSLNSCIRPLDQVGTFTPQLNYFNESELEKSFDRGGPRRRRQPRGRRPGAVPLPDREPLRTFRTPMIGFPEVEKEKDTWVAPSRRQAAMNAERANAQIAVIESEPDIRQQPPLMGTIDPNAHNSMQQSRQMSLPPTANGTGKIPLEAAQKKSRSELLQGPPVAKRVLRSRAIPKSTAIDVEVPLPKFLRTVDEKPKSEEKKKNLYKERELPEGLHPYMIEGVWHCSSCGCPDDLAIGRRQGPLGPKTMCGECGKWWHRHRKPMDIIYRTDREYHAERAKREEEYRKARKKDGSKTAQAEAAAVVARRAAGQQDRNTPSAPSTSGTDLFTSRPLNNQTPRQQPPKVTIVHSPDSSLSPPPFTPQRTASENVLEVPRSVSVRSDALTPPSPTVTSTSDNPQVRPEWLISELARLRAKYPESIFDALPKPRPASMPAGTPVEWRVRCNDCPGKLYNPGAGDTLNNFEIHLKNRQHRQKVAGRLGIVLPPSSAPEPSAAQPAQAPTPSLKDDAVRGSVEPPSGPMQVSAVTPAPDAPAPSEPPEPPEPEPVAAEQILDPTGLETEKQPELPAPVHDVHEDSMLIDAVSFASQPAPSEEPF